jgi:glycerate-2-kinase
LIVRDAVHKKINEIKKAKILIGIPSYSNTKTLGYMVSNRENKKMKVKEIVNQIFYSALRAVDPYLVIKKYLEKIRLECREAKYNSFLIVGFGKASYPMAKGLDDFLFDLIDKGIIITKYGHGGSLKKIKTIEAGHPLPDENGLKGTEEIISLLKNADKNTLVLCLISGGGSALLVSPVNEISLEEKIGLTNTLLKTGADINELNAIRKHISKVKGGKLAEIAYPAKIVSFIISDVIGDKIETIASGPTSPDSTTYKDALDIIKRVGLMKKLPKSIIDFLHRGEQGFIPETPKEGNQIFSNVENIIISSNIDALMAARDKANEFGLYQMILSSEIRGEAKDVGRELASIALKTKRNFTSFPRCLISGGEATVTVKGQGKGGRNMELALAFAMAIDGTNGITLLSAGTDGTDGPTEAAGAIVDSRTIARAKAIGLMPEAYLRENDSYNFFKKINGLFITGPTGTNVMDIQIMIVEK